MPRRRTQPARKRRKISGPLTRTGVGGAKFLNPQEKKFYDTSHTFTSAASAAFAVGATSPVLTLAQGTGASQRVGKFIYIHSIDIRGHIKIDGSKQSNSDQPWKICLMLDSQANGSMPSASDVWEDPTDFYGFAQLDNSNRFRTLKCIQGIAVCNARRDTDPPLNYVDRIQKLTKHIRFKTPLKVTYNSTAGAIAEIVQNNLFFTFANNASTAATGTFQMTTRIRYTD